MITQNIFGMFGLHIFYVAWSNVLCGQIKANMSFKSGNRGSNKGAVSWLLAQIQGLSPFLETGECQVFVGQHEATLRGASGGRV